MSDDENVALSRLPPSNGAVKADDEEVPLAVLKTKKRKSHGGEPEHKKKKTSSNGSLKSSSKDKKHKKHMSRTKEAPASPVKQSKSEESATKPELESKEGVTPAVEKVAEKLAKKKADKKKAATTSVKEEALAEKDTLAEKEALAKEDNLAKEEIPATEEISEKEELPAKEKLPAKEETPDREDTPLKEETPAKNEDSPKAEDKAEDDDEEGEDYKWWEDEKFGQGPERWQLLLHNGVIFPPPYEPLPKHVFLYYDGKPVDLPVDAEEVAGFFGAMLDSDHAKNPIFQKNFFADFLEVLEESGGCDVEIKEFDKCDFSYIFDHFDKLRHERKNMSKAEKKKLKDERDVIEEPYRTCLLNGRKENVGNFKVEPPGLFRGRGLHPKTGKVKRRIYAEDITLNLGEEAPIPEPPAGHEWGAIRHDKSVVWLAMWKENISDSFKYVKLAANSSIKGVSDMKKFETARQLKHHIEKIREDYRKMLKDQFMQARQIATATYLIDVFALRAGGEKGDDEADTVGCCSLRYEHVTLKPPNTVIFDFLGKDSIRFYQEVEVDRQVFKNLRIFKKAPKQPGDDLFDRITPATLNKHLQGYMKGLTAKVFRTYNASKTMQDQMDLIKNEGTVQEKVLKYNAANRTVAILCNHQRSVSKNHHAALEKYVDKIKEMKWQKWRLKRIILDLQKKEDYDLPEPFLKVEEMNEDDLVDVIVMHAGKLQESAVRKFHKENEKLEMEKRPLLRDGDLKRRLKDIDLLKSGYLREVACGKFVKPKFASIERLIAQVEKIDARIASTMLQLQDRKDNSEVSLGTSKLNYIDPRLTVMFSKKFNVPIEKLFPKTLREKFNWAIESTGADWRF